MQEVKQMAQEKKIRILKNREGKDMCPAWHLAHMCNTGCSSSNIHREHNKSEDKELLGWAKEVYAHFPNSV